MRNEELPHCAEADPKSTVDLSSGRINDTTGKRILRRNLVYGQINLMPEACRLNSAGQDPLFEACAPVLHPLPDPCFLVALLGYQGAAPGAPSVHENLDLA